MNVERVVGLKNCVECGADGKTFGMSCYFLDGRPLCKPHFDCLIDSFHLKTLDGNDCSGLQVVSGKKCCYSNHHHIIDEWPDCQGEDDCCYLKHRQRQSQGTISMGPVNLDPCNIPLPRDSSFNDVVILTGASGMNYTHYVLIPIDQGDLLTDLKISAEKIEKIDLVYGDKVIEQFYAPSDAKVLSFSFNHHGGLVINKKKQFLFKIYADNLESVDCRFAILKDDSDLQNNLITFKPRQPGEFILRPAVKDYSRVEAPKQRDWQKVMLELYDRRLQYIQEEKDAYKVLHDLDELHEKAQDTWRQERIAASDAVEIASKNLKKINKACRKYWF